MKAGIRKELLKNCQRKLIKTSPESFSVLLTDVHKLILHILNLLVFFFFEVENSQ